MHKFTERCKKIFRRGLCALCQDSVSLCESPVCCRESWAHSRHSQATPLRGVGWRESVADRLRTGGVSGTSLDRPESAHGWSSDDAPEGQRVESAPSRRQLCPSVALLTVRRASAVKAFVKRSSLVDPASSHMLVSKIKPCMSQCMPN